MARRPLATLLTDFGTRDPYVAAVKGAILAVCPDAHVVDITHEIPPQDVQAAAFVLAHAAAAFPPDTLHVVVVDPTVGTARRILAGRFAEQRYLVPDNGAITFVERASPGGELVWAREGRYVPEHPASATFHGRDVFAPVAGALLNGLELGRLGPAASEHVRLEVAEAAESEGAITGRVIYVDRFGNLVSNIAAEALRRWSGEARPRVLCAGRSVGELQTTYADAPAGAALALVNSMGLLEVAVSGGSAAAELGAAVGAEVRVVRE
jgi:hypothetical protein